jgi:hypothetical protein
MRAHTGLCDAIRRKDMKLAGLIGLTPKQVERELKLFGQADRKTKEDILQKYEKHLKQIETLLVKMEGTLQNGERFKMGGDLKKDTEKVRAGLKLFQTVINVMREIMSSSDSN